MNLQYVEMAGLVLIWGEIWLRDTSVRALFPLKSWFARLIL